MTTKRTKWILLLLKFLSITVVVALTTGCGKNFTHAQRNEGLTEAFSSNQFPMGYRYYFQGRENLPYAIVGLVPGYRLKDAYARQVDQTNRTMESLVDALYESPGARPSGAYIVDLQGRRIGVWYSSARLVSFNVNLGTREVSVISDEPWRRELP